MTENSTPNPPNDDRIDRILQLVTEDHQMLMENRQMSLDLSQQVSNVESRLTNVESRLMVVEERLLPTNQLPKILLAIIDLKEELGEFKQEMRRDIHEIKKRFNVEERERLLLGDRISQLEDQLPPKDLNL